MERAWHALTKELEIDVRNAEKILKDYDGLDLSRTNRKLSSLENKIKTCRNDLGTLGVYISSRYKINNKQCSKVTRNFHRKIHSYETIEKQLSLGIQEGIWRHSHAVIIPCYEHIKLDGRRYKIVEGVLIGGQKTIPGCVWDCLCMWSPIIPGIDDAPKRKGSFSRLFGL